MSTIEQAALIISATRYEAVRYMTVATATFFVYDWMLLFSDEVELIWRRKFTPTKVLYLLSRYSPFIDTTLQTIYYVDPHITPSTCRWNYTAATWSTAFGMGIAELVLCFRTYAIYGRSRKILWTLSIIWLLWVAGNIPVIWAFTRSLSYDERPDPAMVGCYIGNASPIVFGSFASLLLFEIFIVVLTLRKGWHHLRHAGLGRNRTVAVLYRDGIVFFIFMALSSLGNAILIAIAPTEYLDLLDTFARNAHAVLCCHILLNLKRSISEPLPAELNAGLGPHSADVVTHSLEFHSILATLTPAMDTQTAPARENISLDVIDIR